jgi:hypothetical protein
MVFHKVFGRIIFYLEKMLLNFLLNIKIFVYEYELGSLTIITPKKDEVWRSRI